MANIVRNLDALVAVLDGGNIRHVLSHTDEMMVVEITCVPGEVGKVHSHEHIQSSYIKSGVFKYTVGEETYLVREGDALTFHPNELHGCVCLEAGVLLDVFCPAREDFLK